MAEAVHLGLLRFDPYSVHLHDFSCFSLLVHSADGGLASLTEDVRQLADSCSTLETIVNPLLVFLAHPFLRLLRSFTCGFLTWGSRFGYRGLRLSLFAPLLCWLAGGVRHLWGGVRLRGRGRGNLRGLRLTFLPHLTCWCRRGGGVRFFSLAQTCRWQVGGRLLSLGGRFLSGGGRLAAGSLPAACASVAGLSRGSDMMFIR